YYSMDFERRDVSVPFRWSGSVWATTIVTLLLLGGTGLGLVLSPVRPLAIIVLASVLVVVGCMPIRLKVNDEKIIVKRLLGVLEIPLNNVIEVNRISKSCVKKSIRTFGSGGFFGYLGYFYNGSVGHYIMYATELNDLIFIRTGRKKYVFSCSRPEEFIEYVNLLLKR
ncbi:MAG: PH domain-containing protein, partial [Odoribacter sp.]|nr:PH domain-containing protein [Odoribacter sp.]